MIAFVIIHRLEKVFHKGDFWVPMFDQKARLLRFIINNNHSSKEALHQYINLIYNYKSYYTRKTRYRNVNIDRLEVAVVTALGIN